MILRQKATRGTNLAHPNGEIHAIDALRPYQLALCCGHEGRGCSELLGECGSLGNIRRPQASLSHIGSIQRCNGAAV